jgi:hypothetical protein
VIVAGEPAEHGGRDPTRIEAQADEPRGRILGRRRGDLPDQSRHARAAEGVGQEAGVRRGVHDPPGPGIDHQMNRITRGEGVRKVRHSRPGREGGGELRLG